MGFECQAKESSSLMKTPYEHGVGARILGSRPTSATALLFDLEKIFYFWTLDSASVSLLFNRSGAKEEGGYNWT